MEKSRLAQGWKETETLGERPLLIVPETDLDSLGVTVAVVDWEGEGLLDGLPLDDRLPETYAEGMGSMGGRDMPIWAKTACLGRTLRPGMHK